MNTQSSILAHKTKDTIKAILTWNWTKRLLYWIVLSAGTMSECVFLIASLWVTINASVHPFVLVFLSEQMTVRLTQLATVAYVGLPECILALAIVTTLSHIRTWLYNRNDKHAFVWIILYGIPTVIFLVLSLITIGCSMVKVDFQLPLFMVVARGLAGYSYGLIALLYSQLGIPQERDRLSAKDGMIDSLRRESETSLSTLHQEHAVNLASVISEKQKLANLVENLKSEVSESQKLLEQSINAQACIAKELDKSNQPALDAYSQDLQNWLTQGHKSISIEDIVRLTGHHKRTVSNAIANKTLLTTSRNKELIMTDSFVSWLQSKPLPSANENNDGRQLRLVND